MLYLVLALGAPFSYADERLSFFNDIRPIFSRRCAACHTGNNALPSILEYNVAFPLRNQIVYKTNIDRFMPKFGKITEAERNSIVMWVEQGALK